MINMVKPSGVEGGNKSVDGTVFTTIIHHQAKVITIAVQQPVNVKD